MIVPGLLASELIALEFEVRARSLGFKLLSGSATIDGVVDPGVLDGLSERERVLGARADFNRGACISVAPIRRFLL